MRLVPHCAPSYTACPPNSHTPMTVPWDQEERPTGCGTRTGLPEIAIISRISPWGTAWGRTGASPAPASKALGKP